MKRFAFVILILGGLTACSHRHAKQAENSPAPQPSAKPVAAPAGPQTAATPATQPGPAANAPRPSGGSAAAPASPGAPGPLPMPPSTGPSLSDHRPATNVGGNDTPSRGDVSLSEPRVGRSSGASPDRSRGDDEARAPRGELADQQREMTRYLQRTERKLHEDELRVVTLRDRAVRYPVHSRERLRTLYQVRAAENDLAMARRELSALQREIRQTWTKRQREIDQRMGSLDRNLQGIEAE